MYTPLLEEGPAVHSAPSFGKVSAQNIIRIMRWYAEFAEANPILAEYGLRAVSGLIQTAVGGPAGFVNFARSEAQAAVIDEIAGQQIKDGIEWGIENFADLAKQKWNDLTADEAMAWGTASILGGAMIAKGASSVSNLVKGFAQKLRKASIGPRQIEWDKQGKHIPGHKNYMEGRGIISMEKNKLEKLVQQKFGTGQPVQGVRGQAGYKERIDFSTEIGTYFNKNTKEILKTNKGIIHYSNRGIHVTPAKP